MTRRQLAVVRGTDNLNTADSATTETMQDRIVRVTEDLKCIETFYNIEISPERQSRLRDYYKEQLADLKHEAFESFDQQDKIDYLLLQNYLQRSLRQLELSAAKDGKMKPLIPFAPIIVRLCQDRQQMKPMNPQKAAEDLDELKKLVVDIKEKIEAGEIDSNRSIAYRAANTVDRLRSLLEEWHGFYTGYDPLFTWWASKPYEKADDVLKALAPLIREKIVGFKPGQEDAIVGEPIGPDGLASDLEAEVIPYTPEEIMKIGESEYAWCEAEMIKASTELGYGSDWRQALEYVKNQYVEPGKQTEMVHGLAVEAIEYVKKHDLVTVPPIAAETWRMFMIPPERQKVSPFFLGGKYIQVSYPTDTMDHADKLMSMRGNGPHLSRSTVHHELIPGHHLQQYMSARHRPYRLLFGTPFWVEGDALYWELILWDRHFPGTPENRIGMLFWRMHRCARIIFSLKFHLGQMTPQECIDFLVDKVGHERATAEGEVRRSFNGSYTPLYQAGYMLGALQLYALRREVVDTGKMTEKEFHDRKLRENQMPIELLRALITGQPVSRDFKAQWKFYERRHA